MIPVAVPPNVARALRNFDPRLRLIWSRRRKRFEVLEADKLTGHFVHCFYVETEDHRPIYDLGSGDFILSELRSRNAARRFRNDDQFMFEMVDKPLRDMETKAADDEEDMSEEIVKDAIKDFQDRRTGVPKQLSVEKQRKVG